MIDGATAPPPHGRAHLIALAVLGAIAVAIAVAWLASDSRHYANTNSVAARAIVAHPRAGERLCVNQGLWMPAGSDAVRLRLGTMDGAPAAVALSMRTGEGRRDSHARVSELQQDVYFPVRPLSRSGPVTFCLVARPGLGLVGGSPGLESREPPQASVAGRPLPDRVAVWFMEPGRASLASKLSVAVHRASLFRAGFVGPWTYVALLLLLPLLWLAGLRALLWERE